MKNYLIIASVAFFTKLIAQPIVTSTNWEVNQQSTLQTASADWIFDLKTVNGGIITTGYISKAGITRPSISKYNQNGTLIWETELTCFIDGIGFDIYELPNGYIIFGYGQKSGCNEPWCMFSALVDKSNGQLDPYFGVKSYSHLNLVGTPAPMNGATTIQWGTSESLSRTCEIKSNNGQTIGFMLCGAFNDNSNPSIPKYFTGGFLYKVDTEGKPDISFGNGGFQSYFLDATNQYFNTQFHNVCVNYDNSGNIQGYVVVGSQNENFNVSPLDGEFENDAILVFVNQNGGLINLNRFDESTHFKNTSTPLSLPYSDNTDYPLTCSNIHPPYYLGIENNNQRARCVKQISNGGGFVVVVQMDFTYFSLSSSPCTALFPSSGPSLLADVGVFNFGQSGNLIWAQNVFQSSSRDLDNRLLINGNDVLILGATKMYPAGNPNAGYALISKIDVNSGNIISERIFTTNSPSTRICPFAFDLDAANNILIGGDNNDGSENYSILNVQY